MNMAYLNHLKEAAERLTKYLLKLAFEASKSTSERIFGEAFQKLKERAEADMTAATAAVAAYGLQKGDLKEVAEKVEALVSTLKPGVEMASTMAESLRSQVDKLDAVISKVESLVGLDVFQYMSMNAVLLKARGERIAAALQQGSTLTRSKLDRSA